MDELYGGDQVRYALTGQLGIVKEVDEVSQTYTIEINGVEHTVMEEELN